MSTMPFCMTNWLVQPLWFKDFTKLNHVCRLRKVIYGLKQAPKAWYSTLKLAIIGLGFHNSISNLYIFIYSQNSVTCYLLVYVDDLVITSNNTCFMFEIITQLGNRFSLKDMRQLFFSLGIKVISTKSRIFFLSRHKYIQDVLLKTNMISAKNVFMPLSTSTSLKLVDDSSPTNSTNFISFIGAPQYMSLTHPDIFFLVYKLS